MKLNHKVRSILSMLLIATFSVNSGIAHANTAPFALPSSPQTSNLFAHTAATIKVPTDADLQQAIQQVEDGGVIEIAGGTYDAPEGGFQIINKIKNFTIQAAKGEEVILSGGNSTNVLVISNASIDGAGSVVFEGLTFANGVSSTANIGGGVSIKAANATFINCLFTNNQKKNTITKREGGGLFIGESAKVFIFDSIFKENSSANGGGAIGARDSSLYIHNTQFTDNHALTIDQINQPVGGAIYNANSVLRISSSSFQGNTASGHGGAVYGIGAWTTSTSAPRADILVVNSVFENNQALQHSNSNFAVTEGGAINIEDQTLLRIYQSRFSLNSGMIGGGVNVFRGKAEIYNSVFQGNRATDTNSSSGFGGAINFNYYNRPDYASLTVEDTLIQVVYDSVTSGGLSGGGITLGGSKSSTQPAVTLSRVVFNDCDVITDGSTKSAMGGAISTSGAQLQLAGSIVMNSDAISSNGGYGGGIIAFPYNHLAINDTVFANNSAGSFGGSIFLQSSDLNLSDSILVENALDPGATDNQNRVGGAALKASIDSSAGAGASGMIQNNVFSNNLGLPVSEDDSNSSPTNELQYNGNQFYNTTFGNVIFSNSLATNKTVAELNQLVINRTGASSTTKSPAGNNISLTNAYTFGKLLAVPRTALAQSTAGFTTAAIQPVVAYTWNGKSAKLNDTSLSNHFSMADVPGAGTYTLSVDGTDYSDTILEGAEPTATLDKTRVDNSNVQLTWELTSGSYLDMAIDRGLTSDAAASGSVTAASAQDYEYHLYIITKEGGVVVGSDDIPPTLYVANDVYLMAGLNRPPVNQFSLPLTNEGSGQIDWTASASGTPSILSLTTTNGSFMDISSLPYTINITGLSAGNYTSYISISAGDAGSTRVTVHVMVVEDMIMNLIPALLYP